MYFAFTEEQESLRQTARRFLSSHSSSKAIRASMESPDGFDPIVWRKIAQELGWTGLIVPEAHGGYGYTFVELVAVMEEMGRALLCSPFFSSVCLGEVSLLQGGTAQQQQTYLPAMAAGELRATLGYCDRPAAAGDIAIGPVFEIGAGGQYVLEGCVSYVVDATTAGLLIVAAKGRADGRVALFAVPADTAGLERRASPTVDPTRRLGEVILSNVQLSPSARLEGDGEKVLRRTLDRAAVALAAEQLGGAQACLDMAVDYAKVREQFGVKIGSFQAIKHMCADMMMRVESARSAVYYAGWAVANDEPDASIAASSARVYASEAYRHCAGQNIQIHGGIGFTWEHDAHLHFKRASGSAELLGSPQAHRAAIAQFMGLSG